jgi:hypothetical protein
MGHRTFRDLTGVTWQVWDIHPQWVDRRRVKERRVTPGGTPVIERRREPDRRRQSTVRGVRVRVTEGYEQGWLAFESAHGEKLRLAPIPEGWERLADSELAGLTAQAAPVPARRHRPIE